MGKYKKFGYVIVLVVFIILGISIYTNVSGNDEDELLRNKTNAEIRYFESKILDLLDSMNNLETRNYTISTSKIASDSVEKSSGGSSGESSSSGGESSSGESGSSSSSSSSGESSGASQSNTTQDEKKFELKLQGVLTQSEDVNWDIVKSEVEMLYTSIPTITLDLYQSNTNQEDVLSLNRELDQLAVVVKDEDKEATLSQLSVIYDLFPKILNSISTDELHKKIMEVKTHIIKSYTMLDSDNWEEINNENKRAIEIYANLLTDTNIDPDKQYCINKGYVMLNELQNAINLQDVEVYLIKYKNLLEELNNI